MVGNLPNGFLQVTQSTNQLTRDQQMAHRIAAQQMMQPTLAVADRLFISVVEVSFFP